MRFHGLPAGQSMQITAQDFLSLIAPHNSRSCKNCYSFAFLPFLNIKMGQIYWIFISIGVIVRFLEYFLLHY